MFGHIIKTLFCGTLQLHGVPFENDKRQNTEVLKMCFFVCSNIGKSLVCLRGYTFVNKKLKNSNRILFVCTKYKDIHYETLELLPQKDIGFVYISKSQICK